MVARPFYRLVIASFSLYSVHWSLGGSGGGGSGGGGTSAGDLPESGQEVDAIGDNGYFARWGEGQQEDVRLGIS